MFQQQPPTEDQLLEIIRRLPDGKLSLADITGQQLLLAEEGKLAVWYAPFDGITTTARIVLTGITPGFFQAATIYQEARDGLAASMSLGEALATARRKACFSGPMRLDRSVGYQQDNGGLGGQCGF